MIRPKPLPFPGHTPKHKRPKPRKPMTLCMAAITQENYILTVSDTKVEGLISSSDGCTVKMDPFAEDWNAMWASSDMTQCSSVVERAGRYFRNRANELHVARSCMKRAYQKHLSEMAADQVLGRFNVDMEGFLKSKSKRFADRISENLATQIQQIKVDWEFLAFGFDSHKQPHLFVVEEPGTDSVYDRLGFCAVGSARHAAEGLLLYLDQSRICTLHKTLINLLFAKFMAEKTGIGKQTFIFAKKPGSTMFSMPLWIEPTIRDKWDKEVSPRVPDDLMREIAGQVADGSIRLT
jgi:hypothetical protein